MVVLPSFPHISQPPFPRQVIGNGKNMNAFTIHRAEPCDIEKLEELCKEYHQFEELELTDERRKKALLALLADESLGFILIARRGAVTVGYIAICLGFSIELGGRDAYVDEFYIAQTWRGHGIGSDLLNAATDLLTAVRVVALHLEVSHDNLQAKAFYLSRGFTLRDKYFLMTKRLDK
jgi:ribosomal protein S18 acetylase RimI-like enzyme